MDTSFTCTQDSLWQEIKFIFTLHFHVNRSPQCRGVINKSTSPFYPTCQLLLHQPQSSNMETPDLLENVFDDTSCSSGLPVWAKIGGGGRPWIPTLISTIKVCHQGQEGTDLLPRRDKCLSHMITAGSWALNSLPWWVRWDRLRLD